MSNITTRNRLIKSLDKFFKAFVIFIVLLVIYNIPVSVYSQLAVHKKNSIVFTIGSLIYLAILAGAVTLWMNRKQKLLPVRKTWDSRHKVISTFISILLGTFGVGAVASTTFHYLGIKNSITANQKLINQVTSMNKSSLIWIILVSIFIGPIIEEAIFRFIIIGPKSKRFIKKHPLCYSLLLVLSVVLFILGHVASQLEKTNWSNPQSDKYLFVTCLEYTIMGIILVCRYALNNNIWYSVSTHIGINLVDMTIQSLFIFG